jgi:hypothetical protein
MIEPLRHKEKFRMKQIKVGNSIHNIVNSKSKNLQRYFTENNDRLQSPNGHPASIDGTGELLVIE